MVSVRHGQEDSQEKVNYFEWSPLPEEYRTQANMAIETN